MKRNLALALMALAMIALVTRLCGTTRTTGSPFSISHVKLGMTVEEVRAILGPDPLKNGALYHSSLKSEGSVDVYFDQHGKVTEVRGAHLELGTTDYTPRVEPGSTFPQLPSGLLTILGGPPFPNGRSRDFADNRYYPQYNLIVQNGCMGWYFFLRQL